MKPCEICGETGDPRTSGRCNGRCDSLLDNSKGEIMDIEETGKDVNFGTGGGCTAIRYDFNNGCYALVTNDMAAPTDDELESGEIEIGLYREDADHSEPMACMGLQGRAGLNAYYVETVGYAPDESGPQPIHDLLDLIIGAFARAVPTD